MASVFRRGGKSNRHGYYSVSWKDHTGKRRTKSTRTTDKAAAERIAAKLDADTALRREGVIDPTLDSIGKESARSIESHLADYEAKLRAAGRTEKHIGSTTGFFGESSVMLVFIWPRIFLLRASSAMQESSRIMAKQRELLVHTSTPSRVLASG